MGRGTPLFALPEATTIIETERLSRDLAWAGLKQQAA